MPDFRIEIPQRVLDDVVRRLENARWPDAVVDEPDWSWGTPPRALRTLVDRWLNGYDWRRTEARLNSLEQGRVEIDGLGVHYFRAGTRGATPLLLIHGWPDSPLRFEQAIPLLADRFELIVPSVPGYGFSDRPTTIGFGPDRVADLFAGLMSELGFERFGVHGGDIGSTIGESIALRHPDRVIGLHLVDVPFWHRYAVDPATLDADERAHFDAITGWAANHGAYAALQRTKPQTLAYLLGDSPLGLAGWLLEKFQAWSDCDGDVWSAFDPDVVIDDVMVYWVTETAGSSVRYYRDSSLVAGDPGARVTVPTGFAIFPKDIAPAPRAFAERFFDVVRWTEMPSGGHFGALEQPAHFAADVRAFFDQLR